MATLAKVVRIPRLFSAASSFRNYIPLVGSNQHTPHGVRQRSTAAELALPRAAYGGRHTVTLLPGDGVGPELMSHVREVFRYAGVPIDFEEVILDQTAHEEDDVDHALLAIKRNGIALKGNIESNIDEPGFKSRNVELRAELELFANVVHCKSFAGIPTRHENIDLIVIRENTEGEYSGLEHEGRYIVQGNVSGVVESLKIITQKKSTRIARYAFEYAKSLGRKKVTAVHKANIMKLGDGLFLECCRQVSEEYPDIEFEGMIVDNCSMQLVSNPNQFDVMVLPNLYGNIITNIGSGLVGGPGLVPGANIGKDYAIFEMGTRNTGKTIAGKNIANPSAMLLASSLMLRHLGLYEHAQLIYDAVHHVINVEKIHTPDVGGQATSTDVISAIIRIIQRESGTRWH